MVSTMELLAGGGDEQEVDVPGRLGWHRLLLQVTTLAASTAEVKRCWPPEPSKMRPSSSGSSVHHIGANQNPAVADDKGVGEAAKTPRGQPAAPGQRRRRRRAHRVATGGDLPLGEERAQTGSGAPPRA